MRTIFVNALLAIVAISAGPAFAQEHIEDSMCRYEAERGPVAFATCLRGTNATTVLHSMIMRRGHDAKIADNCHRYASLAIITWQATRGVKDLPENEQTAKIMDLKKALGGYPSYIDPAMISAEALSDGLYGHDQAEVYNFAFNMCVKGNRF